jgi:hypothetical protein
MKTILFFLFAFLATQTWSQQVTLVQENQSFTIGIKNAYVLTIPYANKPLIEEELNSFLKEFGKPKDNKGEFKVLLGKDKKVSDKPFDVYARVMTGKDGLPIAVFAVDLGGAFMNSREHPIQSEAMERLLIQFGIDCANSGIDEQVNAEQKILKSLEKEQKILEKNLFGYEKDIANYKEKIKDAEKKISDVKSNQNKKKDAFKAQESKIEAIERKRKTLN